MPLPRYAPLRAVLVAVQLLIASSAASASLHAADAAAPPTAPAEACFLSANYPFYGLIYPHAEHRNGVTYIAFQHHSMDPYVMAYDHAANRWSDAHRAGTSAIADDDSHGNPALWLDAEGRIHLIYGCHGGFSGDKGFHARSKNPGDLTAWEELPPIDAKLTYPQLSRFANGDLLLVYRAGVHNITRQRHDPWGYRISADGGNSWGAFVPLSNGQGDLYCRSAIGPDDRIHINVVWEDPPAIGRQDVYYFEYGLDGRAVTATGSALRLPFGKKSLDADRAQIFDTGGDRSTINPSIAASPDGCCWLGMHRDRDLHQRPAPPRGGVPLRRGGGRLQELGQRRPGRGAR
jgi:BNR repeat-containing family member